MVGGVWKLVTGVERDWLWEKALVLVDWGIMISKGRGSGFDGLTVIVWIVVDGGKRRVTGLIVSSWEMGLLK